MMSLPMVVVAPVARDATRVSRQKRIFPSAAPTRMSMAQQLALKIVPVSAFSGRPPSPGGLNRGSRHVPVHVGAAGSMTLFAWVSL